MVALGILLVSHFVAPVAHQGPRNRATATYVTSLLFWAAPELKSFPALGFPSSEADAVCSLRSRHGPEPDLLSRVAVSCAFRPYICNIHVTVDMNAQKTVSALSSPAVPLDHKEGFCFSPAMPFIGTAMFSALPVGIIATFSWLVDMRLLVDFSDLQGDRFAVRCVCMVLVPVMAATPAV